jgi:putative FmdB family regulatory protein
MPIYAYKCESCGFSKDVLQKISDAPLQDCPTCGKATFKKQVTAAGFQLKGSGWYATDFKGSGSAPATAVAPSTGDSSAGASSAAAAPSADAKPAVAPAAAPAAGSASTPASSS